MANHQVHNLQSKVLDDSARYIRTLLQQEVTGYGEGTAKIN